MWHESTIVRTPGKDANHYTTNVVQSPMKSDRHDIAEYVGKHLIDMNSYRVSLDVSVSQKKIQQTF